MNCISKALLRAAKSLGPLTRQNGKFMFLAAISSSDPSPKIEKKIVKIETL